MNVMKEFFVTKGKFYCNKLYFYLLNRSTTKRFKYLIH